MPVVHRDASLESRELEGLSKYQGKPAVVATVLDMSDRRRIESSLRESEERYRNLFESISDMVQSVDANGRLLFANPAWLNTLGYTSEEAMGLEIFSIIHPDDHRQLIIEREYTGDLLEVIDAREGFEVEGDEGLGVHELFG